MKLTKAQKEVIQKMRKGNPIVHANRDYMYRYWLCEKILSTVVAGKLIKKGIIRWNGLNYRLTGYGKSLSI